MKRLLLFGVFVWFRFPCAFAQEDSLISKSNYVLNLSGFVNNIFLYPEFVSGKIILKDGVSVSAKLNYDRVLAKILFLGRGKTLAFASPEDLKEVIIGQDTFKYFDQGYLLKLTHFHNINLYSRQTLTYYVKTDGGILGTNVIITTDNPNAAYKSDLTSKPDNELSQNSIFIFTNEYYLEDQYGNFYPATRKVISDLFATHFDEVRNYFGHNVVRFSNSDDIEKLLEYLNSL